MMVPHDDETTHSTVDPPANRPGQKMRDRAIEMAIEGNHLRDTKAPKKEADDAG